MDQLKLDIISVSFEENYQQKVEQLNIIKSNKIVQIKTKDDYYVLKLFEDEHNIRWQDKLIEQLYKKETKGIIPFIHNKMGHSINKLEEQDQFFSVMPYIPGRSIQIKEWSHVLNCVGLLGYFHSRGSGIYGKQQNIPFSSKFFDKWKSRLELFERSIAQMKMNKEGLFSNPDSEGLFQVVEQYADEAIQWGYWVLRYFPKAYMLFLEEQAQWERQIAHLDVAPHNFLFVEPHHYYLLDYDLVTYSPPFLDVIQFTNRILHEYEWSIDVVYELIDQYKMQTHFTKMQLKLLPIFLVYPNDLFREWLGLWKNIDGYHPQALRYYFEKLSKNWERRREFVRQCMNRVTQ